MAKQKKKRNKRYQGEDASSEKTQPVVHRYTAVNRGPVGQWWFEKRKGVTLGAKITGVVAVLGWLIYEFIRIVT